jgi:transcriptional regulator with XRE-family HTH domain
MDKLGEKIRSKRMEAGMSLKGLAEKTGVTPGFLSQIERNIADPSITSLRKIATALDVPVFYFLMDNSNSSPVVRKNERKTLTSAKSHLTYEFLCPDLDRQMEMFIGRLQPGSATCENPLSHNGEEVILVMEGSMWIQIGGEEYSLAKGDSIYYLANLPHKIVNRGKEELVFISTVTPPNF